jgi:hypothetical protein
MMMHIGIIAAVLLSTSLLAAPVTLQHTSMHDRGRHAMGFDQPRTTHHFRLEREGGTIEVTAKDRADRTSIDQIRAHLRHVADAFGKGDFSLPMFVHDTLPPGVNVMKERRGSITYRFVELPDGGQVVIRTADADARQALHEFLRFQIREHKTGDPLEIVSR